GTPMAFAALMLLILYPLLVGGFHKRFSFSQRMFCFLLSLIVLSGIIFSGSYSALLALALSFLIAPFFLVYQSRKRVLVLLTGMLMVTVCLAVVYLRDDTLTTLITDAIKGQSSDPRPVLWSAVWQAFLDNPIAGHGMGSYPWLFPGYRPEGFNLAPENSQSVLAELLANLGVIGLLLFIVPVGWLLLVAIKTLNKQELFVLISQPTRTKIVPTRRIYLTGILLAFLALGIDSFFHAHLLVPALLFVVAVYFGLMLKCLPSKEICLPANKATALTSLSVALLTALSINLLSNNYLVSRIYLNEGSRRLIAEREGTPSIKLYGLDSFLDTALVLEKATNYDPNNPDAWLKRAQATLNLRYPDPADRIEQGQQAEAHVSRALEIYDQRAQDWLTLGVARWQQGNVDGAGEAFERAVELSPHDASAWYYLAAYYDLYPLRREQALDAIERAYELYPEDERVVLLQRKIRIPSYGQQSVTDIPPPMPPSLLTPISPTGGTGATLRLTREALTSEVN
ncbi:MAG: O-antigen ligase family protein, partial [Verrucomicrobiota bacterium]